MNIIIISDHTKVSCSLQTPLPCTLVHTDARTHMYIDVHERICACMFARQVTLGKSRTKSSANIPNAARKCVHPPSRESVRVRALLCLRVFECVIAGEYGVSVAFYP